MRCGDCRHWTGKGDVGHCAKHNWSEHSTGHVCAQFDDREDVVVQCVCPGDLPAYQSDGASGVDLPSAVEYDTWIMPRDREFIPTGVRVAIPAGYEVQVRPRSGLSKNHGVICSLGTIDSDYRGPIGVVLYNHSDEPFCVTPGMRIAQLVFAPVTRVKLVKADTLDETARGEGGFGSTGVE